MAVAISVGTRFPAYATSMGRVLLAAQPGPWLDAYLSTVSLHHLTDHTITTESGLRQELRKIRIDGKDYPYPDQLAWPGVATLPLLPSTAIPTGLSEDGLPTGVQIVGPYLEDRTPLKLAELIEREIGGFTPPKMFDD